MRLILICLFPIIISSCSTKQQVIYIKDSDKKNTFEKIETLDFQNTIEAGDILKIDVKTIVSEAAQPYTKQITSNLAQNIQMLLLDGYVVSNKGLINFPVLGKLKVVGFTEMEIESIIKGLLVNNEQLVNPLVKVRRLNSKFTVLGEVRNPGTYSYYEKNLNIFQALGYAGDLTIDGKRKDVKLIRDVNGVRKIEEIELTKVDFLNTENYYIKNNDVIIVNPTFNKVKSAGFIGSPSSIASITSLILSATLLILNR